MRIALVVVGAALLLPVIGSLAIGVAAVFLRAIGVFALVFTVLFLYGIATGKWR